MEDRWLGNEFQILGATDENDLEVAKIFDFTVFGVDLDL